MTMTTPTKAAAAADVSGAETLTRTPVNAPAPAVSSPSNPGGGLRYWAAHAGLMAIATVGALGTAIGLIPALLFAGGGAAAAAGTYAVARKWRARSAKGQGRGVGSLGASRAGAGSGGHRGKGIGSVLSGAGRKGAANGRRGPLAGLTGKSRPSAGSGSRPGLMGKLAGLGKGKGKLGGLGAGRSPKTGSKATKPGLKSGFGGRGGATGKGRWNPLAGKAGKGLGKTLGAKAAGRGGKSAGSSWWPFKSKKGSPAGAGAVSGAQKGLKKLGGAAKKAVWRKLFDASKPDKAAAETTAAAQKVQTPQAPSVPASTKSTTPQARTSGPDQHKHHTTQGGNMGVIADSAEGLMAAIGKVDLSSARKLEAAFEDIAAYEEQVAQAKKLLATRITEEFGAADPGVSEMVLQQAATQAKFANDAKEVKSHFRRAHHTDWERLDNPRSQEHHWDHRTNNQD